MNKIVSKKVSDLGAAAYMLMHGHKPCGRQDRSIIFEVEYDGQFEFEQRVLDYLSSEYHRFDSCLMSLKKMTDYMPRRTIEGEIKKVSDLGAAAYMLMHGHKLIGRQGHSIVFEVETNDVQEFEQRMMDYLSSEYHRFDSCLMSLKKIGESMPNSSV